MLSAVMVAKDLKKLATKQKALSSSSFFKTGPGQYGYGDVFIGVAVPEQRIIAKRYKDLGLPEITKLLESKIHEHRLTALLILVGKFKKTTRKIGGVS